MLTFLMIWIMLAALVGYFARSRGYLPDWFVFLSLVLTPFVPLALLLWLGQNEEQA